MKEQEDLERTISGLKELLRVAWKDLANPALTPLERRGALNQIQVHSAELRRYLLVMEAKRSRSRRQLLDERAGNGFGKPKLRFLAL
jgi:hypothetical protein